MVLYIVVREPFRSQTASFHCHDILPPKCDLHSEELVFIVSAYLLADIEQRNLSAKCIIKCVGFVPEFPSLDIFFNYKTDVE
jgi:hypothetical protein